MDVYKNFKSEVDEVKEGNGINTCYICNSQNIAGKVLEKVICQECATLASGMIGNL